MYDEKYRAYGSVWIFYQSRFLRVWLPFAVSFVMFFALLSVFGPPLPVSKLAGLGLFGVGSHGLDVLGTTWSLDVEVQFYLLVPLIWMAFHIGAGRPSFAMLALGTLVLMLIGWYLRLEFGILTFLYFLPSFVFGAAIWHFRPQISGRVALISLGVFVLLGLLVLALPETRPLLVKSPQAPMSELQEFRFALAWIVVLIPFVAWNVRQPTGTFDMHLGNYSYALYVTHWPIIVLLRGFFTPLSIADKAIIAGAIILVSTIFYLTVDRSCERLRAGYIRRLRAAATSAEPALREASSR